MTLTGSLDLKEVNPIMRDTTRAAFDTGDAVEFIISTDNHKALALVLDNAVQLHKRGIYEKALLHAFTGT